MRQILVALVSASCLTLGPAAFAQPPQVQHANGTAFVSGGVGEDSMAELDAIENQFDLKLFLVGQSGAYLSDIQVTILDPQGKGVLVTTTEGPVLLVNLPSATYTVIGQKNGHRIEQSLTVVRGKLRTVYFRFPGE